VDLLEGELVEVSGAAAGALADKEDWATEAASGDGWIAGGETFGVERDRFAGEKVEAIGGDAEGVEGGGGGGRGVFVAVYGAGGIGFGVYLGADGREQRGRGDADAVGEVSVDGETECGETLAGGCAESGRGAPAKGLVGGFAGVEGE
jgi:hypothetical protein